MYKISKKMEIRAAHQLNLDYESKCNDLHGHNWIITVRCAAFKLNHNGMVVDFTRIKELVHNKLDHKNLDDVLDFNTTAENIARWVVDLIPECYECTVEETIGNSASYTDVSHEYFAHTAETAFEIIEKYRRERHA